MSDSTERIIQLENGEVLDFCGSNDSRIRQIESQFRARVVPRGNEIRVLGAAEEVERAAKVIEELLAVHRGGGVRTTPRQVRYAIDAVKEGRPESLRDIFLDSISVPLKRKKLAPMTAGQKRYVDAIRSNDIVFGVGPAGTGKTYLAVAMAVHLLSEGAVRRIILARPAVEAGEKLGFLPGDIAAKFDPFVRPLYDALYDMLEAEQVSARLEQGTIEIAPLAFMRGRTLNGAFVILDEGQNTSIAQMKMFLTRLGADSKAVVTGDVTQIDLPRGKRSGLVHACEVLSGIKGIEFVQFDETDVVRHELVQKIIRAYEEAAKKEALEEESAAASDSGETAMG